MFKFRLMSFPLSILLIYLIFFSKFGATLFMIVTPLLCAALLYETSILLKNIKLPTNPLFASSCGLVLGGTIAAVILNSSRMDIAMIILSVTIIAIIFLPWLFALLKKPVAIVEFFGTAGVIFVTIIPIIFLVGRYPEKLANSNVSSLFFLIAVTKSMDFGGYIFGMSSAKLMPNGNHKIAPKLSPNKSWEGFFGGLALCMIVALIFKYFIPSISLMFTLTSAVVLGLGSCFGDLTESGLKRMAGVKDSGNIIPGMGGVFDILDSFIYNGILFFILIEFVK